MKILVVGTGAREHALVRALALDPQVTELHAAPGNPGIAASATTHPVDALDGAAVAALAVGLGVDLVVVGPEAPLVAGVADAVRDAGVAVFGPSAAAARLEGSKAFAKEVMAAAGVPTAEPRVVATAQEAAAALDAFGAPYVVKDDGLAAGKGVVVTDDRAAALAHALACLDKPGGRVVVEEFLDGPEVSLFVLSDGAHVVPLVPAQDFKRVGDGDAGPNTGGMGAYSPLPWAPAGLVDEVVARVAQPTVDEMARRGTPFAGVLYCGLALTSRGVRVIEFNARFGDPETQVVLARLATPLAGVLAAAAHGALAELPALEWRDDAAVTVVVASAGYPESPAAATRSPGSRRPTRCRACTSCTRAPPSTQARTGRRASSRQVAGCCPWSGSARTSQRPGRRPTRASTASASRVRTTAATSRSARPADPAGRCAADSAGRHHAGGRRQTRVRTPRSATATPRTSETVTSTTCTVRNGVARPLASRARGSRRMRWRNRGHTTRFHRPATSSRIDQPRGSSMPTSIPGPADVRARAGQCEHADRCQHVGRRRQARAGVGRCGQV